MKKAKSLLRNGNMTVENISAAVGYQNVEHFNRLFKKTFDMTPVQYRNANR
jgi:2-isopropylmalate synthase